MKKPTPKIRKWHHIHARRSFKRRQVSKKRRRKWVQATTRKPARVLSLVLPESVDLEENYIPVMRLLHRIRYELQLPSHRRKNLYVDFKPIRFISLAGALVLAAELYRWERQSGKGKLRAVDVSEWDPTVVNLLKDFGFFSLLNVEDDLAELNTRTSSRTLRYVQFKVGTKIDHEKIEELQNEIFQLTNVSPSSGRKAQLFSSLVEAMLNVSNWAYPNTQHATRPIKHWWLSASFDEEKRILRVMIFDQGVGIPKTLVRSKREEIKNFFADKMRQIGLKVEDRNDEEMIEAAFEMSRSASGDTRRGYGLRDVARFIENAPYIGELKVRSNRGIYELKKSPEDTRVALRRLEMSIRGTLLEWSVHLENGDR